MQVTSRGSGGAFTRVLVVGMLTAVAALALASSALASGSFVIGDENAAVGESVTFWGAKWSKLNALSKGSAPASFKGFADSAGSPPACGEEWTTRPGNSSVPPAAPLPELIDVIVASEITKAGPVISGNTQEVVLVETNPGYESNPGHAGTGTVVGVVCGGEGKPS
jgi:hypothetical protein